MFIPHDKIKINHALISENSLTIRYNVNHRHIEICNYLVQKANQLRFLIVFYYKNSACIWTMPHNKIFGFRWISTLY